jgi:hypothetical protein
MGLLLLPAFAGAQETPAVAKPAWCCRISVEFRNFFGLNGRSLLMIGLLFCVGGLLFGLVILCS